MASTPETNSVINIKNMTIIIVTHELESAFSVADRITVMDRGKQILTGTKEEIRASTDTRIVNMLARKARDEEIDGDAYLDRLMETQRVK
jgi:phospholipid/cholesterol/gamma-HCH transport system ATP-binding protein